MKKKILIGVSIFIIAIIGVLSYVWIIDPVSFTSTKIGNRESWMLEADLKEMDTIYNNNYDGKLPSEDYRDYRTVTIDIEMDYRSFINITGLEAVIEKINSSESNRIVSLRNGTFVDGQNIPENFVTREITGLGLIIYVGDCKSEDEINKIIKSLTNNCEVKMYYSMQWFGARECSYIVKSEDLEIEYIDFTE